MEVTNQSAHPKAELTIKLPVSINSINYTSEAEELFFSLHSKANENLREMIGYLTAGNLQDAFAYYQDYLSVQNLLTELTVQLIRLSSQNFWVSQSDTVEDIKIASNQLYKHFLKDMVGLTEEQASKQL